MNAQRHSAHSARDALASVRAQNPQLAEKLHLASGQAQQLSLLFERGGGLVVTEHGLKTHEWDLELPISKTSLYVTYRCKRCPVQLRRMKSGGTYFGSPAVGRFGAVFVFDKKRPTCPPEQEPRHG